MILPDPLKKLKTRLAWHVVVADHHIEYMSLQHRKRFGAVETNSHRSRFSHGFAQTVGKSGHEVSIIIDEQDIQCPHPCCPWSSKLASCAGSCYQFTDQASRNHEGFRGILWKSRSSISNCEAVACASHGQNIAGELRIGFNQFPQFVNSPTG